LPSIAYRFFIVENESEMDEFISTTSSSAETDGNKIDSIEYKLNGNQKKKKDDIVLIPTKGKKMYGLMSPTMVRSWIMSWVLKHSEFRFLLVLDFGTSSPIVSVPIPLSEMTSSSKEENLFSKSNSGRMKKKDFEMLKNPTGSSSKMMRNEGNGYAMVCVERIADELRYRPNERFYWGTQTCGSSSSDLEGDSAIQQMDYSLQPLIGFPKHPKFQLFSQDVVELLTLAESKLMSSDQVASSDSGIMSSDALLAALKLTLLDDRLRIQVCVCVLMMMISLFVVIIHMLKF
jgi:hypothetical protein